MMSDASWIDGQDVSGLTGSVKAREKEVNVCEEHREGIPRGR